MTKEGESHCYRILVEVRLTLPHPKEDFLYCPLSCDVQLSLGVLARTSRPSKSFSALSRQHGSLKYSSLTQALPLNLYTPFPSFLPSGFRLKSVSDFL